MGNCLFGGLGEAGAAIKVVTSNGGIMEFYAPVTAECITNEFPGHGIFRSHDLFWKPLSHHEELQPGESYFLLPINNTGGGSSSSSSSSSRSSCSSSIASGHVAQVGHVRSNSIPTSLVAPYRMSFENQGMLKRSYTDVFSRYNNTRVWKVKLVICPDQLLEILSQEARTQELIESVRTVAKCGNGVPPMGFSDQWSFSSGINASSKQDGLLEI